MAVSAVDAARAHLRKVAEGLETLRLTLLGIQASLPEDPAESFRLADLDGMDAVTELRAVIGCVANDYLDPAARDLWRSLDIIKEAPGGGEPGKP